jgi:predicted NBD/HSP70 family sugar kinase
VRAIASVSPPNIVTAIHPDLVVLGGGVAEAEDRLLGVRMFPMDDT